MRKYRKPLTILLAFVVGYGLMGIVNQSENKPPPISVEEAKPEPVLGIDEPYESGRKPISYTAEQMKSARMSVTEFDNRFLEILGVNSMGQAIKTGDDEIIYWLDETGELTLRELSTVQGGLRRMEITVHEVRADTVTTALFFYNAAIKAFNPYADPNAIFKMLSLDAAIVENISKPQETTINGIIYTKKLIGKELKLGIAEE